MSCRLLVAGPVADREYGGYGYTVFFGDDTSDSGVGEDLAGLVGAHAFRSSSVLRFHSVDSSVALLNVPDS